MRIRPMRKDDFDLLLTQVDAWWGGRPIRSLLHPVYLYQLGDMAWVAEEEGNVMGFLVGFVSQTDPGEAYIHLVGTAPGARRKGAARALYERFQAAAAERGCGRLKAITSPTNQASIDFHERLGFHAALVKGYSGPGQDRVVMTRDLREGVE